MVPPASHLRRALEELGPTFIKLGQVLSTRPDLLPPPFVEELTRLQDQVPPFPFAQARRQIESELGGPLERWFAHLEQEPLAAASLSQVHAATLHSGEEVVLKVQRPGLDELVALDLDILRDLVKLVEERFPALEFYDLPAIVEEFAHTLQGELDFAREGHHAERFRHNFADEPYLHIPRVYWKLTTHRLLTLERIRGIKIDDVPALRAAGLDPHQVALHATRMLMQEVLEDGFFHGDPHPGNFFVLPGEVIVALDFGMVGRISRSLREQLVYLISAVLRLDAEALVKQLLRMSIVAHGVDREGLRQDLEGLLQRYAGRPLQEILAREIVQQAMDIAFRRRLRLPAELWLLGRVLAMLEGVGLQLDPDFDPFAVARPYAERFLRQTLSPAAMLERAEAGLGPWSRLLQDLPSLGPALLQQLQQGQLSLGLELRRSEALMATLDTFSIQLALALLVATMLVVTALLLRPLLPPGTWWTWLILGGGAGFLLLLLGLLLWTLRPPH
ncbi:MAG: AarF/ABC1/UbiB kinase family protein [Chloroflexia bacterium]|nr:AarF/ABC1/UbiB kinase family protein [Chloroflexia bacterium]